MRVQNTLTTQTHAFPLQPICFVSKYKYTVAIFRMALGPFISNYKVKPGEGCVYAENLK